MSLLSNSTTIKELSEILNIPSFCLKEEPSNSHMRIFGIKLDFISLLKENSTSSCKLPNLSNSISYHYETRFNIATNYSAEELKNLIKSTIEKINQDLNEKFVKSGLCHPFTCYLINQTNLSFLPKKVPLSKMYL